MRDHIAGKLPMFESVHRLKHTDGEWRWVIGRACARVDDQGRLRRLIGVELDITERKLYEEALFREKESAQITLQSIGDGVITCDAHGRVEYLNPVAEELTGWRLEDSLGRTIDEIFRSFHEETCEPLENPLAVAVRRIRSIKSVRPMLLIRKDGNELYIESTASPIRDGSGTVTGGVLVFHDVSESRELNRRLSYHASHDVLTGLVNRREFETRLERALKSAKARETSYALCYIDLDQFKIVNDAPWLRVACALDDGRRLAFVDVRKFGRFLWTPAPDERLAALGPEPLAATFTADVLYAGLRRRARMLKPLLLDQTFVAGLGNIYVDEVLHRARLSPLAASRATSRAKAEALHAAIQETLREAIRREGSSFDAFYRTPEGNPGSYQDQFRVYGRDGKDCRACGATIARLVVGQRGTHVCPRCQPRPRSR
jgi:DNA-formamidopyrimidine glycosylase